MEVSARDNRLRKAISDQRDAQRRYGADMAKKLVLRLAALRAAGSLADFWPPKSGPERCHELTGDRAGTFSVDLKHPYRLLFQAVSTTERKTSYSDEQGRWRSITSIVIVAIEDTHG